MFADGLDRLWRELLAEQTLELAVNLRIARLVSFPSRQASLC